MQVQHNSLVKRPYALVIMAPTPQSKLSKTDKGRLKKLLKRASFDPKSNSPGITCHDEALEIKNLLNKAHPAGSPKDSAHTNIGPSIHHVHSNYGEFQDAENWKQTEGADIRNLIQSFIFGSTQDSTKGSNDGNTKKRKRAENNSYQGTIPSWAKLHNTAPQENLAVIEFDVTTSSQQDPPSIMPGGNDANKESILTKLIREEGLNRRGSLVFAAALFRENTTTVDNDIRTVSID